MTSFVSILFDSSSITVISSFCHSSVPRYIKDPSLYLIIFLFFIILIFMMINIWRRRIQIEMVLLIKIIIWLIGLIKKIWNLKIILRFFYQNNHSTYPCSVGRKKYWDCISKQLMPWTPSQNLVSEKKLKCACTKSQHKFSYLLLGILVSHLLKNCLIMLLGLIQFATDYIMPQPVNPIIDCACLCV